MIRLSGKEIQPIAARIKVVKKMSGDNKKASEEKPLELKLTGTAVFKEDKLIGWLDKTETMGLLFLLGKAQKAGINISCPVHDNKNDEISIATRHLESKITPVLNKDKIIINVKINNIQLLWVCTIGTL